ncbi:MAG: biopolymer transporter ExbD [Gammaproteobacteria bacterium]|nr:biopolymer transporter ExbD [Gammaproteobacteria bacterium]MBL7000169.1 biopolymer transporter ExbD [Gammaproteobacteria bacterium]
MKSFDQINVIPFIDIMLVLLAIVLTTASFIATGMLKIELPDSQSKSTLQQNVQTLEISINQTNQYLVDGEITEIESIQQSLSDLDKQTRIILRVDKRVNFEYFVTIVDLLKQHQLNHLSIITRQNG